MHLPGVSELVHRFPMTSVRTVGAGSAAGRRSWDALAAKHALQERGGLDQLAGARQASGFANYVLIQHRITSFCRRERP